MTVREILRFADNAAAIAFYNQDLTARGLQSGATTKSRPGPPSGTDVQRLRDDNSTDTPLISGATPYTVTVAAAGTTSGEVAGRAVPASGSLPIAGTVEATQAQPLWIIMWKGQSNLRGNSETIDAADVADAQAYTHLAGPSFLPARLWDAAAYESAADPLLNPSGARNTGKMGFVVAAVRALIAAGAVPSGYTPAIVMCGYNSTGFSNDRWRVGDDLYLAAIEAGTGALASVSGSVIGAYVWCQGEEDESLSEVQYAAYLDAAIAGYRAALGDAPWITVGICDDLSSSWDPIRAALADTPNRVTSSAYVSTVGRATHDGLHYTRAAYLLIGADVATAIEALI
jgi:hypothetical protein